MNPNSFLKYANFSSWTEDLPKYLLLIYGHILENNFSFLEFITKNIILDLNVLRSVMEHWFSLKASYSSDHYSISWSISTLMFLAISRHRGKYQTKTYPSSNSFVIVRVFHGLAIHHVILLSNYSDTLSLS
jgi:hypothetical protein